MLKGHKSLGSLCSVVKTLIDSLVRQTEQGTMSPIELLWTAKNTLYVSLKVLEPSGPQLLAGSPSGLLDFVLRAFGTQAV